MSHGRCRPRGSRHRGSLAAAQITLLAMLHAGGAADAPWDARVSSNTNTEDGIISVERCGGLAGDGTPSCAFCARGSQTLMSTDVVFDLSDLRNMTSFALVPMPHQELRQTKLMVSPCGATSWPAPAGYDTTACDRSGRSGTSCFCNADNGPTCSLVGAAGSPDINETWEGGTVLDMTMHGATAQPLGLRVTYTSTGCLPSIGKCGGRCSVTFVFLCAAMPRAADHMHELSYPQPALHAEVCPASKSEEPCSMCLIAASRSMCRFLPCKDNCSNHGLCVDGECRCAGGFTGAFCNQEPSCLQAAAARGVNCSHIADCNFNGEYAGGAALDMRTPVCTCPRGFVGDGLRCIPSALGFHVRGQLDSPDVMAASMVAVGVVGCAAVFLLMYFGIHRRWRRRRGGAYARVPVEQEDGAVAVPGPARVVTGASV